MDSLLEGLYRVVETYDTDGRVSSSACSFYAPNFEVNYGRDGRGNIISETYPNNPINDVVYSLDENGRIVAETYPNNTTSNVVYTLDTSGRIISKRYPKHPSIDVHYTRDSDGEIIDKKYPNSKCARRTRRVSVVK
jgi:hypothetical protein